MARKRKTTTKPTHRAIPDALRNFDSLPNSANVRQPVVEALFGCSSATVWRRVADGGIPRPHKLSDRVTAWSVAELRRSLQAKLNRAAI
jgi:predicted DNA-binding transcriptional regulator AlpA